MIRAIKSTVYFLVTFRKALIKYSQLVKILTFLSFNARYLYGLGRYIDNFLLIIIWIKKFVLTKVFMW